MKNNTIRIGALLLSVFGTTSALATDGYFSQGFGVKTQGIGGVGIAFRRMVWQRLQTLRERCWSVTASTLA